MERATNTRSNRDLSGKALVLTLCAAAMGFVLLGCPEPVPVAPPYPLPQEPGLVHDGLRYYDQYRDGVGDFVYIQMWNFSWLDDRDTPYDASDDVYGVAAFGLANPENQMASQGLTTSLGLIIRPESEGGAFLIDAPDADPAVPGNFSASATFEPGPGFEMVNPGGFIDVISEDVFRVFGHVHDGGRTMAWDLTYTRNVDPGWLPWKEWPLPATAGMFPAWMTYYVHMPSAVVNGWFTVCDGVNPDVTYELDGVKGYHDGFYGEAVFSMLEWDWLDYKQPGLTVHLLHPHGPVFDCAGGWSPCTPGNLRVFCNGTPYDFVRHRDTIEIIYDETVYDPEFGVSYPTLATVHALDEAGNELVLHWAYAQHIRVYYDVPDPFDDNVTYEILADFTGTFYEASSGTTVDILGNGFADWGSPPFPE